MQLKDDILSDPYLGKWSQVLIDKGYTVFVINTRTAPQYHFVDITADCQRAVRFVRFNAKKYGIDANRIGAFGHSSGAILSSMLGVSDTSIVHAENGIDSCSSKIQAVCTLAAAFNLADYNTKADTAIQNSVVLKILSNYVGELPALSKGEFILSGKYAQASPITHITNDDAPFLIYYSNNDPYTPTRQATDMQKKLVENNVPVKIVLSPNSRHRPIPDMDEVDRWFKKYLK